MRDERKTRIQMSIAGNAETQERMAAAIGKSRRTVSSRIQDPGELTVNELAEMVKLLGWSCADLWTVVTGERLTVRDVMNIHI